MAHWSRWLYRESRWTNPYRLLCRCSEQCRSIGIEDEIELLTEQTAFCHPTQVLRRNTTTSRGVHLAAQCVLLLLWTRHQSGAFQQRYYCHLAPPGAARCTEANHRPQRSRDKKLICPQF